MEIWQASLESEFAPLQPLIARASEKYTLRALCDAHCRASAHWLHFCGGQTSLMVPVTRFALSDLHGEILTCAAYGYPSSRTYPFTYRSYPPCFREGTWSAIRRGSVGCEDVAKLIAPLQPLYAHVSE